MLVKTLSHEYTQGGNSGSPVIHEETGHAIGIHTHGGCSATGGSNTGTRIDVPALAAEIDFMLQDCTTDADCDDGNAANGKIYFTLCQLWQLACIGLTKHPLMRRFPLYT